MKVGKNIKKIRELNNYTQEYLAERLGISTSGYSKIERDEVDLTLRRLEELAVILEVSVHQILNFDSASILNFNDNNHLKGAAQQPHVMIDDTIKSILVKQQYLIEKVVEILEKRT